MNSDELKKLRQNESRNFFEEHKLDDPSTIALKFGGRKYLPIRAITEQIKCYQKALKKFPSIANHNLLYESTAIEQASSEITGEYKANQIYGKRIIDLTGGLGIDSFFFSKRFEEVVYCEENEILSEIVLHNTNLLNITNIRVNNGDGFTSLKSYPDDYFDWIYIDPSRREGQKRFVGLESCNPNILKHINLLFSKSANVLIKTSPAIEYQKVKEQLSQMSEFIVVSVNGECKETLLKLTRNKSFESIKIKAVLLNTNKSADEITSIEEEKYERRISPEILKYFYEPDSAIIKSRLTGKIAMQMDLLFINRSVDYLTSDNLISNFPGRIFNVVAGFTYNKKSLKQYLEQKEINNANIARRDFPDSPETIKKNAKLKDGGEDYLFFSRNYLNNLIVIHCRKIKESE